jgi:hypothetical protein
MKVIRVDLSRLRNEEWFRLLAEFKGMVEKFGHLVLNIKDLYLLFLPLFYKADKLLLVLRKSVYTEEMEVADKERSIYLGSLYRASKDMLHIPGDAKKEAAKRLYNLLRQYRVYMNGSYAEESATIYNLLQDLGGKYKSDVTLLALGGWVDALRQAEDRFLEVRAKRLEETGEKPKESLPEIRTQIDLLYNSMISTLDIKLVADGLGGDIVVEPGDLDTGIWEDGDPTPPEQRGNVVYNFVIKWNVILQEYHNLLAGRAGRAAGKKHPAPSGPDPDPTPSDPDPDPEFPEEEIED